MAKDDKKPPLLTGFSSTGAGKGKPLSSPTTSMWLAIIFAALFAGLMSVQRNIKNANDSFIKNGDGEKHSGYIIDAPEKHIVRDPPPNPASLYPEDEKAPIILQNSIELEKKVTEIEIKPIDVELKVEMPVSSLSSDELSN
jgi:hypothetical protein